MDHVVNKYQIRLLRILVYSTLRFLDRIDLMKNPHGITIAKRPSRMWMIVLHQIRNQLLAWVNSQNVYTVAGACFFKFTQVFL